MKASRSVSKDVFELGYRGASEDADQEFSPESVAHAGLGEDVLCHLGFAGKEDYVCAIDALDISVLEDVDVWVDFFGKGLAEACY